MATHSSGHASLAPGLPKKAPLLFSVASARSQPLILNHEVHSCLGKAGEKSSGLSTPCEQGSQLRGAVPQWPGPIAVHPEAVKDLRAAASASPAVTRWGPTM